MQPHWHSGTKFWHKKTKLSLHLISLHLLYWGEKYWINVSSALKDMEASNKSFPSDLLLKITILLKPFTELVKYQKVLPNFNLIFDTRQVQWNCNPKPSVGVLQVSNLVRVWNWDFIFLSVSHISLSSLHELPWPAWCVIAGLNVVTT